MICKSRSYQQNLVAKNLLDSIQIGSQANDSLEKKASNLLKASTSVVVLLTSVNFLPKSIVETTGSDAIVLFLLCVSSLVMFWFAAKLWGPQPCAAPMTANIDKIYDDFIDRAEDKAFANALDDHCKILAHLTWVNEYKGLNLRYMFRVLQGQILLLGMGVFVKVFGSAIVKLASHITPCLV